MNKYISLSFLSEVIFVTSHLLHWPPMKPFQKGSFKSLPTIKKEEKMKLAELLPMKV